MSYQKYIILSSQRSGSTMLVYLLNDHPDIVSYGELFQTCFILRNPGQTRFEDPLINFGYRHVRNALPILFMRNLVYGQYPQHVSAVGFKLQDAQAHTGRLLSVWYYLKNLPDLKIINLQRSNLFHSFVSLQLAYTTREFISLDVQKKRLPIRLYLRHQDCMEYFQEIEQWRTHYAIFFSHTPSLLLHYEDLVCRKDKTMQEVQRFLGVSERKLSCALRKQNTRPMQSIVSNYESLKRGFAHTPWERFFDE